MNEETSELRFKTFVNVELTAAARGYQGDFDPLMQKTSVSFPVTFSIEELLEMIWWSGAGWEQKNKITETILESCFEEPWEFLIDAIKFFERRVPEQYQKDFDEPLNEITDKNVHNLVVAMSRYIKSGG